jgi:hypothetical protein
MRDGEEFQEADLNQMGIARACGPCVDRDAPEKSHLRE